MGKLKNYPFQSLRNLKKWRKSTDADSFESQWLDDVLVTGMENLFKKDSPTLVIRDKQNLSEEDQVVDVHLELEASDGVVYQPWVFTLMSPKGHELEKSKCRDKGMDPIKAVPLEELESPFPSIDILWECENFSPRIVEKAVKSWSKKFWPDFAPEVEFRRSDDSLDWIKELVKECHENSFLPLDLDFSDTRNIYLIGPSSRLSEEFLVWLSDQEYPPLYKTEEGLLIRCPEAFVQELEREWESIRCKPAFK